jgi:serine/threonine protein kinase/tetratricopeptide (TPR) repeat protein
MQVQAGQIIHGRYRLIEQVSQGGVGTIWRAWQEQSGGEVALKLLRSEMSNLPHLRRRFAREARAASRLDHENIAQVYDFGVDDDGRMFIAMELIEGDPVTRCIETGMSALNVMLLADRLLAGLAHAHARGVIHRDLKPSNILLAGSALPERMGVPKLVDFGIAKVSFETSATPETNHGEVVGTPRYMSPEQASGESDLGPQTDIYNVGLILYELITGAPPFGDQKGLAVMSRHVHDPIPPMVPRDGLLIGDDLRELVLRALSKNARDRWATAAECRQDLAPILDEARRDPQADRVPTATLRLSAGDLEALRRDAPIETLDATLPDSIGEPKTETYDPVNPSPLGPVFQRVAFVGRAAERARLWSIAKKVRETRSGFQVLIHGEAGIGKTRLSTWLREQCEEHGVLRAHMGAFTRGSSGGLRGLYEVLEHIFGTRGLARADVEERVVWHMERWGRADSEDIGALVEFLRPHGQAGTLSTSALFAIVARVLEFASLYRPRLILLDDVHWAGGELAEFLDYLAVEMRQRQLPILVISTIRTEDLAERPGLAAQLNALSRYVGESVERIDLERFGREDSYQLVESIFPCDDALTAIVYERSDGNPLHLMLLLRYLREEGLLEFDAGRWRAHDLARARAAMPPSLTDLFHVRVQQVEDRLGTHGALTDLLVRAAVIRPRFSFDMLARLVELEGDAKRCAEFDELFDRLLSEGLLVEVAGRGEDWYQFSHALLRDYFLRQRLGPGLFRKLHRLAAEAMQDTLGARVDHYALEIAAHWRAAGRNQRALVWYGRGGESLRTSSLYRQAASAYTICIELMDTELGIDPTGADLSELPDVRDHARFATIGVTVDDYVETVANLGELLEGFGEYESAEAYFRRIVRMVGRSALPAGDDSADNSLSEIVLRSLGLSWLGLGHIAWQRGDFEGACWAFEKVRELMAAHMSTYASLQAVEEDAARGLARVFWHRGEYARAGKIARTALTSARARRSTEAEAASLWLLGEVDRMIGEGESARAHYAAAMELYRQVDHPSGIARSLLSMAQLARHNPTFADPVTLYKRALARYEALGDRRGAGQCHNGLGDIARFEARFEDARRNYTAALEIYQSIGAEYDVALVYTNLGLTAIAMADYQAADRYLSTAGEMIAGDEYPYVQAGIEFNLALVKALRGNADESDQILEDVLDLAQRFPIPDRDYAQPLERLGRLRAEAGEMGEADALWKKAAEIYRELELSEDLERVLGLIDREGV